MKGPTRRPWSAEEFFTGSGYHTRTLGADAPEPASSGIPSRPPAEKAGAEQPFYLPQNNVNDLRVYIDIASGSFSLNASQITDF